MKRLRRTSSTLWTCRDTTLRLQPSTWTGAACSSLNSTHKFPFYTVTTVRLGFTFLSFFVLLSLFLFSFFALMCQADYKKRRLGPQKNHFHFQMEEALGWSTIVGKSADTFNAVNKKTVNLLQLPTVSQIHWTYHTHPVNSPQDACFVLFCLWSRPVGCITAGSAR